MSKMNLRTKQILIIVAVIAVVLLFFAALFYAGKNLSVKMAKLEGANIEIEKQNKALLDSINMQQVRLEALNQTIAQQETREQRLQQATERINTQLYQLSKKYEAVNRFTINYNADSIRRYFTRFQ